MFQKRIGNIAYTGYLGLAIVILLLLFQVNRHSVLAQTDMAAPLATPTYIPDPVLDSISVPYSRQIIPESVVIGEEIEAAIRLTGIQRDSCFGIPGQPVDLFLVYDISASAGIGPGSNWEETVRLTQILFDHLARPIYRMPTAAPGYSRAGIISSQTGTMGPEPVLLQDLTEDYGLLRNQVANMSPGGDTDLAAGLRMASTELAAASIAGRAQAVLLMLHDNVGIEQARMAVSELNAQGVAVYIMINSLNISPDAELTPATASVLAPRQNIFVDPTPEELYTLFLGVTNGDIDAVAAMLEVVEILSPPEGVQLFSVMGPNGRIEGDRVVWNIDRLEDGQTANLTYQFRLPAGTINIEGGVTWLDCNGYPQSNLAGSPVETADISAPPRTIDPQLPTDPPHPTDDATVTPDSPASFPNGNGPDVDFDSGIDLDVPDLPVGSIIVRILGFVTSSSWIWALLIPILVVLLWLILRWWPNRQPQPVVPVRPASRENRQPPQLKRKQMPTGQDIEQDWLRETVTVAQQRFILLVRPPASEIKRTLNLENKAGITVRVYENDQTVGRARLVLEKTAILDPRTGQQTELIFAHLQSWELHASHKAREVAAKLLLSKLDGLALEQDVAYIDIGANVLDNSSWLEELGYRLLIQENTWRKEIS